MLYYVKCLQTSSRVGNLFTTNLHTLAVYILQFWLSFFQAEFNRSMFAACYGPFHVSLVSFS